MAVGEQEIPQHFKHLMKGIGFILFSRLAFSFLALFVQRTKGELSLPLIVFAQYFVPLLILLPLVGKYRSQCLKPIRPRLLIVWVVFGLLSFFFMFLATRKITITESVLLNNTAPLFVPLMALWALKRPLNNKLWPGIILGFIGIAWILGPDKTINGHESVIAVEIGGVYALFSGIFLAITFLAIALLRHEKMYPIFFQYYLLSSIVTLPFALYYWKSPSWAYLGILLLIGLLTLFTQWGLLKGFHYGRASILSPFAYSSVVFGAMIDWLIQGKIFGWSFFVGVVLICVGGITIVLLGRDHEHKKQQK